MELDPGCFHAFEESLELFFVQLEPLNQLIELGEVNAAVLLTVLEQDRHCVHGSKYARCGRSANPTLNSLQTSLR